MGRTVSLRLSLVAVLGLLLVLAVPLWPGGQVEAADIVKRFGVIGIVQGQTARITVVNVGTSTCEGSLARLDEDGVSLASGGGFALPGSVDLQDVASTALPGVRQLVRAVLTLQGSNAKACASVVIPSIEVFDTTTGQTTFGLLLPPQ